MPSLQALSHHADADLIGLDFTETIMMRTRVRDMWFGSILVALTALFFLTLPGCMTSLKSGLVITYHAQAIRTSITGTQLFKHAVINPDTNDQINKIVPGDGNVLVLSSEHREPPTTVAPIRLDDVIRFQLYLQLPSPLSADSIPITADHFAIRLGDYTRTPAETKYSGQHGYFRIDSLSNGYLFARIEADFANSTNERLSFAGSLYAKTAR